MILLVCPLFDTPEEALDWFEERGASDVVIWRGPDGLLRGTGKVRS